MPVAQAQPGMHSCTLSPSPSLQSAAAGTRCVGVSTMELLTSSVLPDVNNQSQELEGA